MSTHHDMINARLKILAVLKCFFIFMISGSYPFLLMTRWVRHTLLVITIEQGVLHILLPCRYTLAPSGLDVMCIGSVVPVKTVAQEHRQQRPASAKMSLIIDWLLDL